MRAPEKTHYGNTRFTALLLLSLAFSAILPAGLPIPASAETGLPAVAPEIVSRATVSEVVDGDTLVLDSGAHVRLSGIQAPKLSLGRPGFRDWPLAAAAKRALEKLAAGKTATLDYPGRKIDRWRRLLAQVRIDGVWLQEEMVRRGLARVYTFSDNAAVAVPLYAAERDARKAVRGMWALKRYRILSAGETEGFIGTFQLVEGRIAAAAIVRGRAYLNFGRDWRSDFTISISRKDMKLFRAADIDVRNLTGRKVRVRGWLVRENGPMIHATHPEQIERLDGSAS